MSVMIERYEKTANIVNNIKGTKFTLLCGDGRDILWKNSEIMITDKDTLTNLEHSLAHIMYDSRAPTNSTIIEITKTDQGHDGSAFFKEIFYTLEAERVESNWGEIYYGSHQEFERQRSERGTMDSGELDPMRAIQFARNGSIGKLEGTQYEQAIQYINTVHGMDSKVSLKLAIEYYEKYVKDWLDVQISKIREEHLEKLVQRIKDHFEEQIEEQKRELDRTGDKNVRKRINELYKDMSNTIENKTIHDIRISSWDVENILKDYSTRTRQECHENSPKKLSKSTVQSIQKRDMDSLVKQGKKATAKINSKIKEINRPVQPKLANLAEKIHVSNRPEEEYTIDYETSYRLRKLINEVKASRTQVYDMQGNMIDVDEYIQDIINTKQGIYWEDEEPSKGLAIVIGIDCSGSMPDGAMQACRDMCATILYATQRLKDVAITFVPWSTSNSRHDLYANEFTTLDEIKCISKNYEPQNANDLAHQYLDRVIAKSNAVNKVIIMMTDGEPYCHGIDPNVLFANTVEAIRQSKLRGNLVYGVFLNFGANEDRAKKMAGMYRSNFVSCNTMNDASKAVIELTQNHILRAI